MKKKITCPQCRGAAVWQDNPYRPFCSERCKLTDLGQWADESYRIPGPVQDSLSDDNIIHLQSEKHETERS